MIHIIELILCRLIVCILLFVPFAQAADDDINIPYTDTYGYVYDPATGSFVKNDPPEAASTDTTSPLPVSTQHDQSTLADTTNKQTSVIAAPEISNTTDPNSARAPWVILALVVAGMAVWRLLSRSKTAPVQNSD